MCLGIIALVFAMSISIALIPIVGGIANALLPPVLGAGLMVVCHTLHSGNDARWQQLFSGFGPAFKPLVFSGLLLLLLQVVAILLLVGPSNLAMMATGDAEQLGSAMATNPMLLLIRLALMVAFMVPITAATLFSPALIMLGGLPIIDAIKASIKACFMNAAPLLLWGAIAIALTLIGLIPAGLGMLVVLPVLVASGYLGFRDIFVD